MEVLLKDHLPAGQEDQKELLKAEVLQAAVVDHPGPVLQEAVQAVVHPPAAAHLQGQDLPGVVPPAAHLQAVVELLKDPAAEVQAARHHHLQEGVLQPVKQAHLLQEAVLLLQEADHLHQEASRTSSSAQEALNVVDHPFKIGSSNRGLASASKPTRQSVASKGGRSSGSSSRRHCIFITSIFRISPLWFNKIYNCQYWVNNMKDLICYRISNS